MTKAAEQYKAQVKRSLFCGRSDREHLLDRLTEMLDDFQQARPEADYAEYAATFGEPAACAAELLSSLGESKFEAVRKKRLLVRRGVYVAILAVFVLVSSFWCYKYYQSRALNKDTVVIIEPVIEVSEDVVDESIAQTPKNAHSYEGE